MQSCRRWNAKPLCFVGILSTVGKPLSWFWELLENHFRGFGHCWKIKGSLGTSLDKTFGGFGPRWRISLLTPAGKGSRFAKYRRRFGVPQGPMGGARIVLGGVGAPLEGPIADLGNRRAGVEPWNRLGKSGCVFAGHKTTWETSGPIGKSKAKLASHKAS